MMKSTESVPRLQDLNIKIFSDGADLDSIIEAYNKGIVKGFTTNPTLMAKAGITNYLMFAEEVLRVVKDLSVSFEVFSDDFDEMREQALRLAELADNVYVKIPVTQHGAEIGGAADPRPRAPGSEAERDGDPVAAAGRGGCRGAESESAGDCFRVCRPHRRFGP